MRRGFAIVVVLAALGPRASADEIERLLRAADFEGAAALLESQVDSMGCTIDAVVAARRGIELRRGLGDDARAERDLAAIRRCARRNRALAEPIAALVLEQADETKLAQLLEELATDADADHLIAAHLSLARSLWRRSCPIAGYGGACVEQIDWARTSEATRLLPLYGPDLPCGPPVRLVVHRRDGRLARLARQHLARIRSLEERRDRTPASDAASSEAHWLEMEPVFEARLAVRLPDVLDFTPVDPYSTRAQRARDRARLSSNTLIFNRFLQQRVPKRGRALYPGATPITDPMWRLASLARNAVLETDLLEEMSRPGSRGSNGCAYEEPLSPMDSGAPGVQTLANLRECSDASHELGPNPWSTLCAATLDVRLYEHNLPDEIVPTPPAPAPTPPRASPFAAR